MILLPKNRILNQNALTYINDSAFFGSEIAKL